MAQSMQGPSYVTVEVDEDGRIAFSEILEEDGADWWTIRRSRSLTDGRNSLTELAAEWTCYFNGPQGWKHAGGLRLLNWEPAY